MSNLDGRAKIALDLGGIGQRVEARLAGPFRIAFNAPYGVWKGVKWRLDGIATKIYSETTYSLAFLHRRWLRRTIFIGVTGSAGKTTTKDLIASILESHAGKIQKGSGSLNFPINVSHVVLSTRASDAYCVTEIAVTNHSGIDLPVALFRPMVGVVTNIGGDHVSAYGNLDALAAEKSKLVKALPNSGIAVLNADDPRVLAMASQCVGRTMTYGMGNNAMLRGEAIDSEWPSRLSFTVKWDGQSARVRTQLCGSHWVPVVLAALATGVALGVPLEVAVAAVAAVKPFEGRMSPVELDDGVTFMRDDWKAPFWTIAPTFEFMRHASAERKIIVMGTISDYVGASSTRYVEIAREALAVADCVLFVGPRSSACLRAKKDANDQLFAFPSLRNASTFLQSYLQPGDLVLLKGSVRTDHLQRLILTRRDGVACWRSDCARMHDCSECPLLHKSSEPEPLPIANQSSSANLELTPVEANKFFEEQSKVVVVGLGNPGERYIGTPHNLGHCVVDILAKRLDGIWTREGDLAMVSDTNLQGRPIRLMKLLTPVNEAGSTLLPIAQERGFSVKECIFIHDDLDLPMGAIRTRQRGSDGGHRGVQSIIQAFQDDKFRRVKIGIGKPPVDRSVIDYVLTPFPTEQLAAVDTAKHAAADRILDLIRQTPVIRPELTLQTSAQRLS